MIVTIATDAGPREVHADHVIGEVLAVHPTVSSNPVAPLFTLSHLPTGYAVVHHDNTDAVRRIGETLLELAPDVLALTDHEKLKRQMPKPVADWLLHCREHGWTEPPATGGTKMATKQLTPEQAVQKQQALAEKLAKGVMNRHVAMIASEYRKAIRAAKTGQPGDPAFMREQFKKDFLFDIVQVACAVANIPVPKLKV